MSLRTRALLPLSIAFTLAAPAVAIDWQPFAERDVVEILTRDADGSVRETKVWIVVLDGAGYVRTNDSRWLANIRRGSEVELRLDANVSPVRATEREDPELRERVEAGFRAKYGLMQRVMSALRISEPTLLELQAPRSEP